MDSTTLLRKQVQVEVIRPTPIDSRVIRARVLAMKRARARYLASFAK